MYFLVDTNNDKRRGFQKGFSELGCNNTSELTIKCKPKYNFAERHVFVYLGGNKT
jgi:hypothetical protein